MKIHLIAGARPNFVKVAALSRAFARHRTRHARCPLRVRIVNTGQHYDYAMTRRFFRDLAIPAPAVDLEVGSGSHADQTAKIMSRYEKVARRERPALAIVVGDVNSTLACSLVLSKLGIPVAHVEAGLRSFDRTMPEEINRLVTDALSDYLFVTAREAIANLRREGIPAKKIFFPGNVMVDSLLANLHKAARSRVLRRLGLSGDYAVLTLHRPSNVDRESDLREILRALARLERRLPIVFPVHPRTAARLRRGAVGKDFRALGNLILTEPLGYLDFIQLMRRARLVLTDSGGIQEETAVLGVPCVTLRDNTERPVTLRRTNVLAGRKASRILRLAERILSKPKPKPFRPEFWDGRAAERIVRVLSHEFGF